MNLKSLLTRTSSVPVREPRSEHFDQKKVGLKTRILVPRKNDKPDGSELEF